MQYGSILQHAGMGNMGPAVDMCVSATTEAAVIQAQGNVPVHRDGLDQRAARRTVSVESF